jgi:hypothetical protein
MPEFAFIDALSAFLGGPAALHPVPVQVGPALPVAAGEAPTIVLALETVQRLSAGLGEGAEPMTGILPVEVAIDLAAPFLPGEPAFSLLSPDRTVLTLPHGGLIRADGLDGVLGPADITISVDGAPRTLVAEGPGAGEYSVDAVTGQLTFGAALPATGTVSAGYHLGAWERQAFLIAGQLALTARAAAAADVSALSAAAARALAEPGAVSGLRRMVLTGIGAVEPPRADLGQTRGQMARYSFEYEHLVDAPSSSGGIIHTTPLTTHLRLLRLDQASGAPVEDTVTETG